MESLKPTLLPTRSRAVLLATACLITPLMAGEPSSSKEASKSVSVTEAHELLTKGDEAYTAGRYHDAVQAYSGARDMIPENVDYADLRSAASQRYAQAAVEDARAMVRKGDLAGAKALLDKVNTDTASGEPTVVAYRTQLDDPIRTNPALTAEHGQDVDEVRRELYTADGAFNLGNFDDAKKHYERVLKIDPYNTAARRGMERVAATKSEFYKSASDQGRASMLEEVAKQWELQVTPADQIPALGSSDGSVGSSEAIPLSARLDRIIIPKITMEQTSLAEAVEFLRVKSRENDTLESDPAKKGVNITINMGTASPEVVERINKRRFDLRLGQVPLSQVLRYITADTQTSFSTDDYSVIISPAGSTSNALITRTFRVPPDFVTSLGASAPAAVAAADPFADKKSETGVLAKKLSAQEALVNQGVTFPEGASASYTPANSILRVTNTSVNLDQIEQIVSTLSQSEPVAVAVRVTMIKAQETTLKELGFDWVLNNFGFAGASAFVPGASLLNLTGGTIGNGGSLSDIVSPVGLTLNSQNTITSGNRSGDSAIQGDSIDAIIASNNTRNQQSGARAPGVLGINGFINTSVVQVMMRGLDQKKGVDLLSQPSVVTRSGQAASVHIIREFIYPTEYEPPELPNDTANTTSATVSGGVITNAQSRNSLAVTPSTPTAFEKRDVGTILEVLPVADSNKRYVDVTIKPTFTEFDGFVNYGVPINTSQPDALGNPVTVTLTDNAILMPVFSTQRVSSSITIADGATIVIAGMLKEKMQTVNDKVPILGDLPAVGRLFQTNATSPEKTAIIFLVNVELLDPTGRPYRDR